MLYEPYDSEQNGMYLDYVVILDKSVRVNELINYSIILYRAYIRETAETIFSSKDKKL